MAKNTRNAGIVQNLENLLTTTSLNLESLPRASADNATTGPIMQESRKLLEEGSASEDDSDNELVVHPGPSRSQSLSPSPSSRPNSNSPRPQRQSSFAQPRPDGTPRTPNRVRFQEHTGDIGGANGHTDSGWLELEAEDYLDDRGRQNGRGRERVQRLPLLTGIEAPSVTVADEAFDPADHLESARPKSGMRSAFMNMANSIMYV